MASTMLHLPPLDLAGGPLSPRPRWPTSTSRISSGLHPKPFPAGCDRSDAAQVDPSDADGDGGDAATCTGKFLSSYGRRRLTLTLSLPFMFPQYHIAKAVDIREEALVIQNGVSSIMTKAKAAGMLRLAFHDAGTFDSDDNSGGMNGSIVYELERPENVGLNKSIKVLTKAKMEIEKTHPVSWADLIAVAGAQAVSFCGGPTIPLQLGRIDVRTPDPEGRLPEETLDASGLKDCFFKKGFSTQELVALSGAHTIGGKGFGSPVIFDNAYYKILLEKPWASSAGMSSMIGLPSDRAIADDDECLRWIKLYAVDQEKFFGDFKNAYIKLVNSGASWKIV
ncbi:putative L-ascorbate peroxidase 6 isoform X1 [Curcuma longa]|uniref:putative L-ascorbate peroxidase 6 isoform X1 n=1 Tax=Curcuma longa TaxID=136217 RepID=UPI003D9EDA7B